MNPFYGQHSLLLLLIVLWTIPWKIYALWTAVKYDHKKWFVALVILNTFSILEIFYIFYIAKKKSAEVKQALTEAFSSLKK